LEDATCGGHAAQVTRREPVQFPLFTNTQAQAAKGEKNPVEIEERDETKTDRPARGRIVGSDAGKLAVHQVQPNKRENPTSEIM
jgi:hypothetical protein